VRPLLLLDVDGVLMPTGRSIPPGFERHTTLDAEIVVARQHGEWLHDLLVLFEVVWATTWGESADRIIGGFFGLPPLPVLQLGELPRSGTRKLGKVAAFVGDRALAWVDDELYNDAAAWAEHRSAPTLLVRTSGTVGLKRKHFDQLKLFGEAASAQHGGSQV